MSCAVLLLTYVVDAVETTEGLQLDVGESGQLGEDTSVEVRCTKTKGSWCSDYLKQAPVPWRPAPRGDQPCTGGCNNVGRCNYDTGYCDCPAGWTGHGCKTRQKRPCTNHFRTPEDPNPEPLSHIGPDKRDLNWTEPGFTPSRCYGICDDDLGMCYCDGPLGRIPAPDDAPAGTPPRQRGRPLLNLFEQPSTTYDGKPTWGGHTPYEKVYGPEGYCNVSKSAWKPSCGGPEDLGGEYCDQPNEAFCPGACSGHGACNVGFCICDEGYYGHDCARRKAGLPLLPSRIPTTPWLASVVREPPAALEPPPSATRRRPLIYVYDLEPLYNAKMLQYRHASAWCTHRFYDSGNVTNYSPWCYGVESGLHEYLLVSEHRTFDPEEADFFYVPVYTSCLIWPVLNYADFPVFYANGGTRVMHAVNMLQEAREWIDQHYPFWKRRSGRDHIWTFPHDEGACWAPKSITKSVWLTHWGRTDVQHTSKTSFEADNYTRDFVSPRQPKGYTYLIEGHVCYDPKKDLVVPIWRPPLHYARSPLQGAPAKPRDIFLFFRGDVGKKRSMLYSRGVRQKIYNMSITHNWREKYNVLVGDGEDVHGDYSDLLSRSLFCLVATGDGWSARTEDAVLHGCIPVMVIDGVHMKFETLFDVDSFSIRIPEADVANILTILKAVPPARIRAMQISLGQVWHRYRYAALPGIANTTRAIMASNEADPLSREADALSRSRDRRYPRPFKGDPAVDDAFSTIIQWLHSRIPDTR
ncbi:hypothetical protein HYH02_009122 [Chlamydomonas schloesseri]|uniref:EGF-like domain-containing protein n=1 Tax=Chlamydomonas schloesseri TaxID=2026947 RepID=A0A835WBA4_9CHLO|nr:hypothetical protein HYH02_009122 [Chlamydomonas schloesseri]|eukprot:KAG2444184.1 hypothetical protein HYH02_009122 [Chlamydomonas schloesseri]